MFDRSNYEYSSDWRNYFFGSFRPADEIMGSRCSKKRGFDKNNREFFAFYLCGKQGGCFQHFAEPKNVFLGYDHPHADFFGIDLF